MKARTLVVLPLALGAFAFAVQQKQVLLNDKKGEFKIYDVESAVTSFAPQGDMEFEASGSPLRGYSKKQGLAFSASSLEGRAARTADGSLRLKRALVKGNVILDAKSSMGAGGGENSSHIEAASLLIDEGDAQTTISFDQPFTYANHMVANGTDRTITLRAPGGKFFLPLLDQAGASNNPFRSADVKGPVNIDIDSLQRASNGTAQWKIAVKADAMTYDSSDRTIRLIGHVTGDVDSKPATGEPFGFTVNADWLNVILDENSAVKSIKSGIGSVKSKADGE